MALFAIADLHLSLASDKKMDVFPGWENYVEKIEQHWRTLVSDDDTVVIAGDVSWGMSLEEALEDFLWIHRLPGKKLIIKGNHDYWWSTVTKMQRFLIEHGIDDIALLNNNAYLVDGIAVCGTRGWFYEENEGPDRKVLLREAMRLETSICEAEKNGGVPVAFLHYPPIWGNTICHEILEVLKAHKIERCYFGHIHGEYARRMPMPVVEGMKLSLISADYLRFVPVRVSV
jgi:predicted phosphohydrolase